MSKVWPRSYTTLGTGEPVCDRCGAHPAYNDLTMRKRCSCCPSFSVTHAPRLCDACANDVDALLRERPDKEASHE